MIPNRGVWVLRYLRDLEEIGRAQADFQRLFRSSGEIKTVGVGYRGGSENMEAAWLPSENIWCAFDKLDSRYWNAFGVGEPDAKRSNSITVEINFPLQGVNRTIGGILAKDDQKDIVVLHRGKIGGGKKGIGPQLFRDRFSGKWESVEGDDAIRIGTLAGPDFLSKIAFFVKEVALIKQQA